MIGTAAFWFSIVLVAYWAYWNFHRPHPPAVIRHAVTLRRYLLATSLYIAIAMSVFLVELQVIMLLHDNAILYLGTSKFPASVPLATALLVTVLLPELPGPRAVLDEVRGMVQRLALFPDAARHLAARLAAQPCAIDAAPAAALRREIARYGLSWDAVDRNLARGAVTRLEEAQALHDRFRVLAGQPALRRFVSARAGEIDAAQQEHRRLLRRAARAMVLAEAVVRRPAEVVLPANDEREPGDGAVQPDNEDWESDTEAVSDFVAEESSALGARYRRLIAEAALSCFVDRDRRRAFIESFGYRAPPDRDLPFWAIVSLVCVFPATFLVFLAPLALTHLGFQPPPGMPEVTAAGAVVVGTVFASQQVIVVLWAVVPKILTRFARPSLRSLPWASYVAAGFCSYLCALAIRFLLMVGVDRKDMPDLGVSRTTLALVTGVFAVIITVGLSIEIDRKLRDSTYRFTRGRWLDGALLAAAIAVTDIAVQAFLSYLGGRGPGLRITGLLALMGFVIGFLVPSSVAAYLNEREAEMAKSAGAHGGAALLKAPVDVSPAAEPLPAPQAPRPAAISSPGGMAAGL